MVFLVHVSQRNRGANTCSDVKEIAFDSISIAFNTLRKYYWKKNLKSNDLGKPSEEC